MATKIITSYITKNGIPQTGITPTIKIWEITPTTNNIVIASDPLSEIGDGLYKYVFNSYDHTGNFLFIIDCGSGFPPGERYLISANESYVEEISSEVWEEPNTSHDVIGTMGNLQNNITEALAIVAEILKYNKNRTKIDATFKTLTIFDDDGITPINVFDLLDDNGVKSIQDIFERLPQ